MNTPVISFKSNTINLKLGYKLKLSNKSIFITLFKIELNNINYILFHITLIM